MKILQNVKWFSFFAPLVRLCWFTKIGVRNWNDFYFKEFYYIFFILKIGVKINLKIITKNHATDSEIGFLTNQFWSPWAATCHTNSVVVKNGSNRKPASSVKTKIDHFENMQHVEFTELSDLLNFRNGLFFEVKFFSPFFPFLKWTGPSQTVKYFSERKIKVLI